MATTKMRLSHLSGVHQSIEQFVDTSVNQSIDDSINSNQSHLNRTPYFSYSHRAATQSNRST